MGHGKNVNLRSGARQNKFENHWLRWTSSHELKLWKKRVLNKAQTSADNHIEYAFIFSYRPLSNMIRNFSFSPSVIEEWFVWKVNGSTRSSLDVLSVHACPGPGQLLLRLVCVEEVQHKHTFSCTLGSLGGALKRFPKFSFSGEWTGGEKIFSVCRSIHAKCMSSVFSSPRRYLSSVGFLCIVKLFIRFTQYAACSLSDPQNDEPFWFSFLLKSHGFPSAFCLRQRLKLGLPYFLLITNTCLVHWGWPLVGIQITLFPSRGGVHLLYSGNCFTLWF